VAFGIKRHELQEWKRKVSIGEIALITHFWYDERFPKYKTVTKAGCSDLSRLISWGKQYGLKEEWIHDRKHYPHFDLLGDRQVDILRSEGCLEQLKKFKLTT
jgi:hypothetical protein